MTREKRKIAYAAASIFLALQVAPTAVMAKDLVGIITKTNTNSFFVKMREGAEKIADERGLELQSFAGRYNGDHESQLQAIENLIGSGAKGFAITPNDSVAIVPAIKKAREAGLFVVVLDAPTEPIDAPDATFATDNFKAGLAIGQWARKKLGESAKDARVAFIDLSVNQTVIDYLRNQGFMQGFGIDVKNPTKIGDEDDVRIVGHQVAGGTEDKAQAAMENLFQKDPSINVVYAFDEATAAGAARALKSFGKDDGSVLLVSIDGGCDGVRAVRDGTLNATSQQYPLKMAAMAIEAIDRFVKTGEKPKKTEGLQFVDTGVKLVTDQPVVGVPALTSKEALETCW